MTETRKAEVQFANQGHAQCGAPGSDITRTVDIISAQNDISGAAAYRLLVQVADNARFSVRETARAIAQPYDAS